jgi:hypothetical protein
VAERVVALTLADPPTETTHWTADLMARASGISASRRDAEHGAHERHRIVGTAIFDEAESHFGTPAKIAMDLIALHA